MNPGIVTVGSGANAVQYIERPQDFPLRLQITTAGIRFSAQLSLPGQYAYRLKAVTRTVLADPGTGFQTPTLRPFLFKFGNSTDGSWFTGGAVQSNTSGIATDAVLDTNFFGTGQLPRAFTPDILYVAGSVIMMELTDVSLQVPYEININFMGSYLVPINSNGSVVTGS